MNWLRRHFESLRIAVVGLFAIAALTVSGFGFYLSVNQDDLCHQDQRQWSALHKVIVRATIPSPAFLATLPSEAEKIAYLARAHASRDTLEDAQGPRPKC